MDTSISNAICVTDIASATTDDEVRDFFAFCGKISDIKFTADADTKSATVTFAQDTAAKTALMLNNTQLGPNQIHVTPAAGGTTSTNAPPDYEKSADGDTPVLTQEEKPRTRIVAEYLAHGYVIGDAALQKAIDLDHTHDVTGKFMTTLTNLDKKYHATEKAKTADESYHITSRAGSLLMGIGSYFEKASTTPTGKKLVNFYTVQSRQVQDIHAEARRLADLKKEQHGGNAYKASGLERVFGKEKPAAEGSAPAAAAEAATSSTAPVAAPTETQAKA